MLEISWFAFYLLLHLLLSAVLLPLLLWLSRQALQRGYPPALLLKGWYLAVLLLFVMPVVLLQPWALDSHLMPWFHHSVQQAAGMHGAAALPPGLSAGLSTALSTEISPAPVAIDSQAIRQVEWPLAAQVIYYLAPAFWFWLLLPLISVLALVRLLLSYRATRRLIAAATAVQLSGLDCPLPVKSHPKLQSAMLVGLRQPTIILPEAYLQQLDQQQLEVVLEHEVCHQQQGDLAAYLLQQVCGALCWWSPAWRWIAAELNRWRELRCDALVSAKLNNPQHYAQILLDCALLPTARSVAVLGQRWWQQPLLVCRVEALLQPTKTPSLGWYSVAAAGVLLLAGMGWLAQQWQLADLPARYAKVRLSQLAPLTQLLDAVRQQDLARLNRVISQGAPLNIALPGDGTALMLAVRTRQPAVVEQLLAAGADVNISSRGDGNALIIAAQLGDLAMASHLLAAGADVNAAVLADETALINASMRGDLEMAALLLSHGALINLQVRTPLSDGYRWRSPLNQAGSTAMRDFLLARGAR